MSPTRFLIVIAIVPISAWVFSGCRGSATGADATADASGGPPLPMIASHSPPYPTFGEIERLDADLDELIPPDARLVNLAEGFEWSEGPVWAPSGGFLLFSDIPRNSIFRWRPGRGIDLFMKPSGYHGSRTDIPEPGTNGLTLDPQGRLVMCEHGNRRVSRLASWDEPNGRRIVLAEAYEGKRLNSPNDLVFDAKGNLYFTDPPYGLAGNVNDPEKELDFQGVYLLRNAATEPTGLVLLTKELSRPNGIGLSPDGGTLYVANSDPERAIWMAYDVRDDGTIANGRVFFDATPMVGERKGLPDGLAVDAAGNLWATGPGGVLVFSPDGRRLGTILTGQATANCTFGDDGSMLYITADMILARLKTSTKGQGF